MSNGTVVDSSPWGSVGKNKLFGGAITSLAIAVFGMLMLASSARADSIDRSAFFDRCEKITKSKKYFKALDRNEIKKFYLSSATFRGVGKDNINLILDEIEKRDLQGDKRQVAYVLGTAFRETASTLIPVHEAMGCKTEACIHKYVGAYGQPKKNGKSYYGRGFSQLTHDRNYKKFGQLLGLQPSSALYDNPDLALEPKIAAAIIVIGMFDGYFTDKYKLSDFFSANKADWVGARKMVNPGSPRAAVTAGYGKLFYECITGESLVRNGEFIE